MIDKLEGVLWGFDRVDSESGCFFEVASPSATTVVVVDIPFLGSDDPVPELDGLEIKMPSTSTPFCKARTPNGISVLLFAGRPVLRSSLTRALFSSSTISCFAMIRFPRHNLIRPAMKTSTIAAARTNVISCHSAQLTKNVSAILTSFSL